MLKLTFDCDGCGTEVDADIGDDGVPVLPEGWISLVVERRALNPEYVEQAESQQRVLELQVEAQMMMAGQQGVEVTDALRAETRRLVEPQVLLSSPIRAEPEVMDRARAHYCDKDTCGKKIAMLIGGEVQAMFVGDVEAEGGVDA